MQVTFNLPKDVVKKLSEIGNLPVYINVSDNDVIAMCVDSIHKFLFPTEGAK